LALLALLFWQGFSFAKESTTVSQNATNPSDTYWFLALLACLLAGYLMGSRRSRDEERHHETIEKKLGATDFRLKKQQEALAVLTQHQLMDWQTPADVFKEITEISAKTLDVERVGIWLFSHNKQQLECVDLYLRSKNLHTIATTLQAAELPEYFRFLSKHRVIAADDVMHHPATVEFTHGYAQENKISALLDGTIWLNNQIIGLICHEHINDVREWTLDEQNFVGSLADLTRLTIETDRRRKAEIDLLKHQRSLEDVIVKRTAEIESSSRIYRFLVERAPVIILYMNDANEVIEMNPEAERVSGYSREFAIGKTYEELFSSPDTKLYNQAFVEKLNRGETKLQGEDLLVKCADGSLVELSVSRSIGFDADGKPVIISIGQDMSKQKALEVLNPCSSLLCHTSYVRH
jgi:PAS domain S-box-containing protein